MPTTAEGRAKAARVLMHLTGLDDHALVSPYINLDASPTAWDWEGLGSEPLSTGERIALEVLRTCVLGSGDVRIQDMYHLDDHYRRVCLDALRLSLIGDEVPVL